MVSLQLKSAGPELVKAISCKQGAPVVILANLAVLKMWRGKGLAGSLLEFAQVCGVTCRGLSAIRQSFPETYPCSDSKSECMLDF